MGLTRLKVGKYVKQSEISHTDRGIKKNFFENFLIISLKIKQSFTL
jgi:hypothetical protein